jgi:NADP-dependent aldehyde dehydrogenase
MGAGQFCTNPNLLLVPAGSSVLEELPRALAGAAGAPLLTAKVAAAYRDSLADPRWRSLELVVAAATNGPWDGSVEVRRVELGGSAATPDLLNIERFGPAGLVATYDAPGQLDAAMAQIEGSLTISVHADDSDHEETARLLPMLARRAGRVVFNGWPTGVAVCWAMHHGGPWPATTASAHTSVGGTALRRWLIPVAYQDVPDPLLPAALRSDNPLGLPRTVQP